MRDAEDIHVTFANDVTIDARLIGTDDKTDIAVLQVEGTKDMDLTAATFGDSDALRVGGLDTGHRQPVWPWRQRYSRHCLSQSA